MEKPASPRMPYIPALAEAGNNAQVQIPFFRLILEGYLVLTLVRKVSDLLLRRF